MLAGTEDDSEMDSLDMPFCSYGLRQSFQASGAASAPSVFVLLAGITGG